MVSAILFEPEKNPTLFEYNQETYKTIFGDEQTGKVTDGMTLNCLIDQGFMLQTLTLKDATLPYNKWTSVFASCLKNQDGIVDIVVYGPMIIIDDGDLDKDKYDIIKQVVKDKRNSKNCVNKEEVVHVELDPVTLMLSDSVTTRFNTVALMFKNFILDCKENVVKQEHLYYGDVTDWANDSATEINLKYGEWLKFKDELLITNGDDYVQAIKKWDAYVKSKEEIYVKLVNYLREPPNSTDISGKYEYTAVKLFRMVIEDYENKYK